MECWRVVDTGLRPAAQNIALSRALLEARRADEIPSTLRFLRFAPSALLGHHQSAEQQLDLEWCRADKVSVQRRITGGAAVYVDEAQIGWELYLSGDDVGTTDMRAIARRICHAAATAVSALGVDARYRPRGDIEVDGRRIADTGGAFDGDALLYQATLLVDCDVEKMLRVLRLPAEKPSDKAVAAARERVADLKALLGRRPDAGLIKRNLAEAFESEFGVEFREGDLSLSEHARYQVALAEIDNPDWVHFVSRPAGGMPVLEGVQRFAGGLLRARVMLDTAAQTVHQVWFTGDVPVKPRRMVVDLEAALRDTALDRIEARVHAFFAGRKADMRSLTQEDFVAALRLAARQPLLTPDP